MRKLTTVVLASVMLNGCVAHLKTVEMYDAECQVEYKKKSIQLDASESNLPWCDDKKDCKRKLDNITIFNSLNLAIVGSIVLVGNTIHWLEKVSQGCEPNEVKVSAKEEPNTNKGGKTYTIIEEDLTPVKRTESQQ